MDFNRFRKNTIITVATTILRFGIRLIKNVVFTRLLGPADKGVFTFFTAFPGLLVSLGDLGFGLGIAYLAAKGKYSMREILGNTLIMIIVLGVLITTAGYFLFSIDGLIKGQSAASIQKFMPFVLVAIIFVVMDKCSSELLIATSRITFLNLMGLVTSSLPVAIFVLLALSTKAPLQSAMYAWLATTVLVAVVSFVKLVSTAEGSLTFSPAHMKGALSFGSRSYFSLLADELVRRVDYFFVATMAGAEALGYYSVTVSVAEILLALPDAITVPFIPERFQAKKDISLNFSAVVIRYTFSFMIVFCILTAIFGKLMILILFGKQFLPSYSALIWILPGILFLSIYNFLKIDMYSRNLPGMVSIVSLLTLVCNVVLNVLLIPSMSFVGAAVSSTVAYGMSTLILLYTFHKLSHVPYRKLLILNRDDIQNITGKIRRYL